MNAPAVSVLMPVLNPHPVYFPEAVASIVAQTLTDWELIIVEDPSNSSAAELLKPLADPRIRLIANSTKTGLIAQRNRTISEARADLIAMMDADDVAEPNRLVEQVSLMAQNPKLAIVGCQLRIIDSSGADVGHRNYPTTHREILRSMPRYNAIPQPGVMARKQAILRHGGYAFEWPAEDYDLWSRMLLAGEQFANSDLALVRYRVHAESGSKGTRTRQLLRLTSEVKRRYWWGAMNFSARLRYWGERGLLVLPPSWVVGLFAILTFNRRSGAQNEPPHRRGS
jgi:glycosyltransferase involved in cell wall biosynthesis